MALISYRIQLTSAPVDAGPEYFVFYSTDCSSYTFAGSVNLYDTSTIDYVDVEETSTCIKLKSLGNCTNEVVSGSSPSSSSYNTHLVTLTQKNGSGPEFIVSENTSSLFTYLDTIELASQGATSPINPDSSALAVRFRSNGVCISEKTVQIGGTTPTPTPTPTSTPTPTPTATIGPTPTPTPTPNSSCFTFYTIYGSTSSATDACCNQFSTKPVYLDASSLATATAVFADSTCTTLRSTPTYYTQNLNDYYYWTGASLVGPTTCPGCP